MKCFLKGAKHIMGKVVKYVLDSSLLPCLQPALLFWVLGQDSAIYIKSPIANGGPARY